MNLLDFFILIKFLFNYVLYTDYRYFQLYDIVCFKSINIFFFFFTISLHRFPPMWAPVSV